MTDTAQTLRDLIDKALAKRDTKSVNQLAKVGQDAGYSIKQTTLSQIYNGSYKWRPKPQTLEAISYLAGVPYAQAHAAAGLGEPGEPFKAASGAEKLTPKEREVVNSMIRALLDARALERSNINPNEEPAAQASVAYLTDADLDDPDVLPRSEQQ